MNTFWGIVIIYFVIVVMVLLVVLSEMRRYPICYKCGSNVKIKYDKERKLSECRVHGIITPLPVCPYCQKNFQVKWDERESSWKCTQHGLITDLKKERY